MLVKARVTEAVVVVIVPQVGNNVIFQPAVVGQGRGEVLVRHLAYVLVRHLAAEVLSRNPHVFAPHAFRALALELPQVYRDVVRPVFTNDGVDLRPGRVSRS